MTSSTVDLREHRSRQAGEVSARTMASAVVLTFGFVVVEAIAGVYGRSLALLSDAGHNLADVAALGLSWYALAMGRRPSNHGMTYGYHRVAVVAAMVNAASLGLIALWIVWEAVGRLRMPEPANSTLMIGVALAAIIINVIVTVRLHEGSKSDINIRSAYLHMMGDAVAAFAVILAGVIVAVTERVIADPLVSMVIAAFILWSSYGVLRESATVLLEGTPPGTDMEAVIAAIRAVSGVTGVHDLHVWMVGPGIVACSCHIVVPEQTIRQGQQVVRSVVQKIEDHFQITHTTIQVEVEGCEPNDLYCAHPRVRKRTGTE